MKKITKALIALLSVLIIFIAGICIVFYLLIQPVSQTPNNVEITIKEGSSSRSVLESLESKNIIKSSDAALIYAKLFKKPTFLAGKFVVDSSWSLDKIFEYMSDDKNIIQLTTDFTIFPGSTLRMIASNLQDCTNLNANEILKKWNDKKFVEGLMDDYHFLTKDIFNDDVVMKLEGYLFPDTYNIFKETTIEDVTRVFLDNTNVYYNKYSDLFSKTNMSINEIFTLASIIDYEASDADDRKMVSSVFYNRLNIGMPLQSSVTRCYALSLKENRNITEWSECEIELDFYSPYDTYQNYGLPPGPIRCVSETSLVAALEPSVSNNYYFIGDVCGDGTVYFAETYARHNQYIQEILTKC